MAFDVSYIYNLVDNISPNLKKIQSNVSKLDKSITDSTKRMSRNFTDLGKKMATRVTLPLGLAGGMALKSAAKMENLETSFVGILGSGEKASALVKDLFEFTAKTPFQLEGVAKSAKQLLAAGVSSEKMTENLQMLGDISAAANVPLSDMSQIFAKIKNKGKAMTEEILQMSDRGIPVIDILSREFGVTKDAVFEMASKSQISFKMMERAMQNMTKEGGFAHKAMILQSKTLTGVISTMRDNITLAMGEVGEVFIEDAKKMAIAVTELAQKFKVFAQQNPGLIKVMVTFSGILALLAPLLIFLGTLGFAITGLITTVKAFAAVALFAKTGVIALKAAMLLLNTAFLASPLGFIGLIKLLTTAMPLLFVFKDIIVDVGNSIYNLLLKPLEFFQKLVNKIPSFFSKKGNEILQGVPDSGDNLLETANQKTINQHISSNFAGNLDINFNNAPSGMTSTLKSDKTSGLNVGVNSIMGAQ